MQEIETISPQVGIYIVFKGMVIAKTRDVKKLNGCQISDDAGEMFHTDLVRQCLGTENNPAESQFIKEYENGIKMFGNEGAFKIFPRGRVYYVYDEDMFYVALPENDVFTKQIRYEIQRNFHLKKNKFKFVRDSFYNI